MMPLRSSPLRRKLRRAELKRFFVPLVELLEDRKLLALGHDALSLMTGELHESLAPSPIITQYHLLNAAGYLTDPAEGAPLDIALDYLRSNASDFGLTAADFDQVNVWSNYVTDTTGVTHVSLRQMLNGLDVEGANFNVNVAADGSIINVGGGFVSDIARFSAEIVNPYLDALTAAKLAADQLDLTPLGAFEYVQPPSGAAQSSIIAAAGISLEDIPAHLHYVAISDTEVELAWDLTIQTPDGAHWFNLSVGTHSGVIAAATDYGHHADYNVYPLPTESPNHGPRLIEVDPHVISPGPAVVPSPFGWHDTNGVVGAEFTITRGNNVNAYADTNNDNSPDAGSQPDGGAGLSFNFPIDLSQQPITYQAASVANLFYWNNIIHDVTYLYGFNEASRNFQVNNYGRGGVGNDAVNAEAQDGGGINNANFFTPPDGSPPRMQMYLGNLASPMRDGSLDNGVVIHEYGHGISNRLTGNGSGLGALQSGGMGEGWSDWFALMFTQTTAAETTAARGIGTYLFGQAANGPGIRSYQYDFDIGNLFNESFQAFGTGPGQSTQVHWAGTRWSSALWDLNHLLIQKYGYEPNLYNSTSTAGNIEAMHLVMNGLKLQPVNPSFINARDAILAADTVLNASTNHCEIWTAFARRGLGAAASTASSSSSLLTTDFTIPVGACGLAVTSTVPANGSTVGAAPAAYTVNVNTPVAVPSLQASDFLVNGSPATSVAYVAGSTTMTFTFAVNPVAGQGLQTMSVPAGAFNRASDNGPVAAFNGSFRFDALPLAVVSTSPPTPGGLFSLPAPLTYDVNFNEPIAPGSVGTSDLTVSQGSVTGAIALDADTARYTISGISSEGTINITVKAGELTDPFGNPNPAAFAGSYEIDITSVPYPAPLDAKNPLGSLIYDPSVGGVVNFPGDVDEFTLNIDPGQVVSVLVDPTGSPDPSLYGGVGNGAGAAAGRLLAINQTSGAGTIVGDPVTPGGLTGLVYDPSTGFFLGSTIQGGGSTSTLVRIHPDTGALVATIGAITDGLGGPAISIGDLAIQPGTNTLFGIRSNSDLAGLGGRLYTINKTTGVATLVGHTGSGAGGGISFAPDGSLYQTAYNNGFDFLSLNRLNPVNAARISTVPLSTYFDGLAIRPSDGAFFGAQGGTGETIYRINPTTGAITAVGNTGAGSTSDLAFRPSTALVPSIEVRDPANVVIGTVAAAGPGLNALLQTAAVATGGVYKFRVSGAGGAVGGYSMQLTLNAALEAEGNLPGVSNNTTATAQNIDASFIALDTTLAHASRGAVLGQVTSGNLIVNGGFETGSFLGWTVSSIGVNGWQINNGTQDPVSPSGPLPPISGAYDAFTDPTGPGIRSLTQAFVVPAVVSSATLSWSDRIQNHAGTFVDPTQEFRVQILNSVGGVLATVFSTNPGDPGTQLGPNNRSVNVTGLLQAFAGQTLQVRFEEQDSLFYFNATVDNVSLVVGGAGDVDHYAVNLAAGDSVSLALEALTGSGVQVELLNAGGGVIAVGAGGPTNYDRAISNFVVPSTGVYYARVSTTADATYSLTATRNAAFDTEGNDSLAAAQNVTGTEGALGHIGATGGGPTLTLNWTDSGWWNATGFHDATNDNYFVGQSGGLQYRDYFVFNLAGVTQPISSATLQVYNPAVANGDSGNGYISIDPTETYTVFDVSTPLAALQASNSGQVGIFNDLGTGVPFGATVASPASNGQVLSIPLNAPGVAALNAAAGGSVALGGAITTLLGGANQALFGFSGFGANVANHVRRLALTFAVAEDWYKVTLGPGETVLDVESRTPADGPGEFVNIVNPKIQLFNAGGTDITPAVNILGDGRNEQFRATGLTPGATYYVKVSAEGSTSGEYFVGIQPLRTPTITVTVDDGDPSFAPARLAAATNPIGWSKVVGSGHAGDYSLHVDNVAESATNFARWTMTAASSVTPIEVFASWVARPQNATNATYQIYNGATLVGTTIVNQKVSPNDVLIGTTVAESLGTFLISTGSLTVRLLTLGANGDVVADAIFDPPVDGLPAGTPGASLHSVQAAGLLSLAPGRSVAMRTEAATTPADSRVAGPAPDGLALGRQSPVLSAYLVDQPSARRLRSRDVDLLFTDENELKKLLERPSGKNRLDEIVEAISRR